MVSCFLANDTYLIVFRQTTNLRMMFFTCRRADFVKLEPLAEQAKGFFEVEFYITGEHKARKVLAYLTHHRHALS